MKSNLNVFICGNLNKENTMIIDALFTKESDNVKLYETDYTFRVKERNENLKEINFNISWKCFILNKILDSNLSENLINHIKNLTEKEKDKEKEYHNVILYFSDDKYTIIVNKLLEKKGELTSSEEKKRIVEQKLPFLIIFDNTKRDDTKILRYINYIPKVDFENNINNIKRKLIAIDAYYNEKGTLYKDIFSMNFSNLSIKILLIGKTGAGKSTFINTSFGELVARSSPSLKSVTSKCTEYLLPYKINEENKEKCQGRIMLIDTPGFENEESIKYVKKVIENYTKNAKDSKDMVHCALYFLKEGDRLSPHENEIFDYILGQKIGLFFIVTRSDPLNSKTKHNILDFFKNKINEERIINVNLVKQRILTSKKKKTITEIPIIGMEEVYDAILKYLKPEIYNDKLFNSLQTPPTIEEKLKVLKKISFLFQEFNSIEDLKKGSHIKGNAIVTSYSCLAGGCGFIPIPFLDIAPVIGIQIAMIISLAKIYGIKGNQYKLKDIILSGGCSLGDAAVNAGVQSAMDITKEGFKTVFKEVAEEAADEVTEHTIKNVVKEVLKEGGEKGSSGALKCIPGIGTLIGGLISAAINAGFTISMGKGTMKLFEDKLLGDDNGYSFLKNRIKGYQNIFLQLQYYSENENWYFEEWDE